MLLGEILGNQIGKMQYFTLKESLFYKTTEFAVSAWSIDQKLQKIPKIWSKTGQKFNIFKQFTLLNRDFSYIEVFSIVKIVCKALLLYEKWQWHTFNDTKRRILERLPDLHNMGPTLAVKVSPLTQKLSNNYTCFKDSCLGFDFNS